MEGEGMVAVVRGLKDSGLAVTVVDGDRRYTLTPNLEIPQRVSAGCQDKINYHCNSSAQAVDGRYTSTYQAVHCNVSPTSPIVHVDEFPPQRSRGCAPGHGNFEVGGAGSGETYVHNKKPLVSHGTTGTEKGCTCSPQISAATCQFASSLRKYPCLTSERSSEIVERLVNYSPTKHLSGLSSYRHHYSPTRLSDDCYIQDRAKSPSKSYREAPGEPDIATRIRKIEKSAKEKRMESAGVHGDFRIPREFEVRYFKEIPKRRVATRATNLTPTPKGDHKTYDQSNNFVNSVDTESQAAVMMVSREVSTVARPAPSKRTVAVPLTPSPSTAKDEEHPAHHRLHRTIKDHDCQDLRYSTICVEKPQTTIIRRELVNSSATVNNSKVKNIPIKGKPNKELIKISSQANRDTPQRADKKLIHTLDDPTKIIFANLKNLRLSDEDMLQKKVKHFLHKSPNVIFDIDKEVVELPQLPENILSKTVWPKHDINTSDNRENKYYSRYVIENLKIVVKKLLTISNINRKRGIDETISERDIYNYVIEKLEPIALDRAKSDTDYKNTLKLNITMIVNDLSLLENLNSNLIDTLVNEIIAIDGKIPITYIQPTDAEIKQFINDQIIFVLEKSSMTISTTKMKDLEHKLIDHLLDLTVIEDINNSVIEEMANTFEDIVKLPTDKAKYYTKIILNDYKEFFFRHNFFSRMDRKKYISDVSLEIPNKIDSTLINQRYFEQYTNKLVKEIKEWFTNLNIEIKDCEHDIKQLACDIVDRQEFLAKHPNMKGTISQELEHLKYQLYKRTSKLIGNGTLEHVEKLMSRINLLQLVNLKSQFVECSKEVLNPDVDSLISIISGWFHKLSMDIYRDSSCNRQLIRVLAEDIVKYVKNNNVNTIDAIIDKWIIDIFKKKIGQNQVQGLKDEILMYLKNNILKLDVDHEKENINIKKYKRIINDWINTLPLQLNKSETFVYNRNNYVYTLATKIHDTLNILSDQSSSEDIYNILKEKILESMKILPLDEQSNQCRDKYAGILVTNIKLYRGEDVTDTKSRQTEYKLLTDKLENAMLDCTIKTSENTNQSKNDQQSIRFNDLSLYHTTQDESLEASVEAWLNKLPIQITDFKYFNIKKNTFIENIKLLRTLGATDEIIINEIIKFMKTLPMEIIRRQNCKDFEEEEISMGDKYIQATPSIQDDTAKVIEFTLQKWARPLSATPIFSPKKLTSLIDKVVPLISDLINQYVCNLNDKNSHLIREEIVKFLETFPQKRFSEQTVTQLANCLTRNLKDIIKCETRLDMDINGTLGMKCIDYDTAKDDLDIYTTQIVNEISNWLNDFFQKGSERFNVIINDLANDIIDRELYLELNPKCRKSSDEEVQQLQFQIFKRISKLLDTQKIYSARCSENFKKRLKDTAVERFSEDSQVYTQAGSAVAKGENSNTTTAKQRVDRFNEDNNTTSGFSEVAPSRAHIRSNPGELDRSINISRNTDNFHSSYQNPREAIFGKYQTIFKNKVYDLPIYAPTPESEQLAELARTGIYNAIMKTFFSLKSDQELENDYGYFELILEDKLDEMLDLLPQTEEMKKIRHGWKVSILSNAMDMLKEIQEVSDRPSFRQRLKDGFNRKFARNFELEQCFLLQQGFLAEMAEAYILETKYKEDDPLKANIYKQRLMKKVDEMANHLTRQHNIDFRFLKKPQLIQHAMKILAEVPIPSEDILNDEVEEILLAEEIEQWYRELPVTPYINDFDRVFRKRMMNILAQKIYEIDKIEDDLDHSKERQIKHEISNFLTGRGRLERAKDLNINFMVDELNNRLKNRRLKHTTNYEAFANKNPVSSTFAKLDNSEILAPLIDESTITDFINKPCETREPTHFRVKQGPLLESRQICNEGFVSKPGSLFHGMAQNEISEQQSIQPYSNGIPFQWPAEISQSIQNGAQDMHDSCQEPLLVPRSASPRSNLETNRIDRQGQFGQFQRMYVRGTKSLSPQYMPRQDCISQRRHTSPEIKGPRSTSPCKMGNFKAKPHLESIYYKQKQTRKQIPSSSINANVEMNRPGAQGNQTSAQNAMGNVIIDNNQNENGIPGSCMHQGTVRCNPNCKSRQARRRGLCQPPEQSKDKPKIIVKCECSKDLNKQMELYFDSQPCPCKLLIKPCRFY